MALYVSVAGTINKFYCKLYKYPPVKGGRVEYSESGESLAIFNKLISVTILNLQHVYVSEKVGKHAAQ